MNDKIKISVPDVGGASQVDVIEILVQPGDIITLDTPLITLESDKASMDIPATQVGKVDEILVKVGDKVSEGDAILTLCASENEEGKTAPESKEESQPKEDSQPKEKPSAPASSTEKKSKDFEVNIPDIGGASHADVIDVMVQEGDRVEKDQALITLEGDKATMDIPSPNAGLVKKVLVKVGEKVSQGSPILMLAMDEESSTAEISAAPNEESLAPMPPQSPPELPETTQAKETPSAPLPEPSSTSLLAGPGVRRLARELGVDLSQVSGKGRKGRIMKEDVTAYIKKRLQAPESASLFSLPALPAIDFNKFGSTEIRPLNKIKRITAVNMHRSWITIPHVTQFDEADVTDLEAFRKAEQSRFTDTKLTLLAFVTKVVSQALLQFPQFNSSLDTSGEQLILKHYVNIGIAVETPNGLVVPVLKNVPQLSVTEIANEMGRLSKNAREKGITPADMSGGSFTISSLGGIGGTAFTPIVNSPEVAILGLSRTSIKPIFHNNEFLPRLMLPLSLSYDHRVIDGAEAARFTRYIAESLSDLRRILL